jgi:hypothetical protein
MITSDKNTTNSKKCPQCGISKDLSQYSKGTCMCKSCKSEKNKAHMKVIRSNPEKLSRHRAVHNKWQQTSKGKKTLSEYFKGYRRETKAIVIENYGGKCNCCGTTVLEFLTIDHINGGGRAHRKTISGHIYRWLINNNFPKDDYQLLCMNCNSAKGLYNLTIPQIQDLLNKTKI